MDDESFVVIEEILRDDEGSRRLNFTPAAKSDDHQWQTVRRRRRNPEGTAENPEDSPSGEILGTIEGGRAVAAHNSAAELNDGNGGDVAAEEGVKAKKEKKPKAETVGDVAGRIDASDLAAFLADITGSFENQENILLMRFADYFGRAFASISAADFPWVKTLQESSVAKMIDIPVSHISQDVYKTSTEWLNLRSSEALGSLVLWLWDNVLADLEIYQGSAKGPKKLVQQAPSKSQVATFVVLAMTLRQKPEVLISLTPILRETSKYQGQDKLPFMVWVIAQACQGDLAVGLFMWTHFLLPMVNNKSSCNPQSRDLILQLVERILTSPKSRRILLNGAVRKGERLVPPTALELLTRVTFPASSARVKATERFEAVFPTLKEVAFAGSVGSKSMKQVTQQILHFVVKLATEGVPELSKEATNLAIWCLTHHPDSYKQWDKIYLDNLEASVLILEKLANEWKDYSAKVTCFEPLKETLTSFKKKNMKAMATEKDATHVTLFKDAEKFRKLLMTRLSGSHTCIKGTVFVSIAFVVGATAAVVMSHDTGSWDVRKLVAGFV